MSRSAPLVVLSIAAAVVIAYGGIVAGGATWDDAPYHTQVTPPRLAAATAIQHGDWPAWWDGTGLGVPLAAEPSHGALYPPTWLASSPRTFDWLLVAHLAWAGIGIAIWARRRSSDRSAALGGMLVATSGILVGSALRGALFAVAHVGWLGAAAAMLRDASDRRSRALAVTALGAVVGAIALGGQLGVLIDAIAIAVVIGASRASWRWLAAGLACGLAIGALQWLPAALALGDTAGSSVGGLPFAHVADLVAPIWRSDAALPTVFVGAGLIALAACARFSRRDALLVVLAVAAFALPGGSIRIGAPALHLAVLAMLLGERAARGADALLRAAGDGASGAASANDGSSGASGSDASSGGASARAAASRTARGSPSTNGPSVAASAGASHPASAGDGPSGAASADDEASRSTSTNDRASGAASSDGSSGSPSRNDEPPGAASAGAGASGAESSDGASGAPSTNDEPPVAASAGAGASGAASSVGASGTPSTNDEPPVAASAGAAASHPASTGAAASHVAGAGDGASGAASGGDGSSGSQLRARVALGVAIIATAVAAAAAPVAGLCSAACLAGALACAWRPRGWRMPLACALLVGSSAGALPGLAPLVDRDAALEPLVERALVSVRLPWVDLAEATRGSGPVRVFRPVYLYAHPSLADAIATFGGASAARWDIAQARSEDPARAEDHDRVWLAAAAEGGALLDRFGISLAVLPSTLIGARHLHALARRGAWALVALPVAPVAAVFDGWHWAVDPDDALALMFSHGGGTGILRGSTVLRGGGTSRDSSVDPKPCAIDVWRAGDIALTCTAERDSYAVISSASAPGWSVAVDDRDADGLTADVMRRAVAVPAGTHHVHWTYATPGRGIAALLALLGLAGLISLVARR